MREDRKLTICVDFDGVIHSYERGWQDGKIYGTVVPGFFEWAKVVNQHFDVVIYSSRSSTAQGLRDMQVWLNEQHKSWWVRTHGEDRRDNFMPFRFSDKKPPAWLTIDDRAICFDGNWSAPELSLDALRSFKPWNVK